MRFEAPDLWYNLGVQAFWQKSEKVVQIVQQPSKFAFFDVVMSVAMMHSRVRVDIASHVSFCAILCERLATKRCSSYPYCEKGNG
jgi:hypothetical protein